MRLVNWTTMPGPRLPGAGKGSYSHGKTFAAQTSGTSCCLSAETVAAPAENWEELLATCGEADRRFLDKVLDMLAKEIAYNCRKSLRKSLDTAAVVAAIDGTAPYYGRQHGTDDEVPVRELRTSRQRLG